MAEVEVPVYCYWNGKITDGPYGIDFDGSYLTRIMVKRKTPFNKLLDQLYQVTRLDRRVSKIGIVGRFPSAVQESIVKYIPLLVVNDASLETMLDVPSKHPHHKKIDLYLQVTYGVFDPASCSSPLADPGCSSKRQRTNKPVNSGRQTDRNSGSQGVVHVVDLTEDSRSSDNNSNSNVSKPCMSSLWLDDHDLRVGLCFKDSDELKKAVDWCSIKGQQRCVVRVTSNDRYMVKCIRWRCKWSLRAARIEEHGLFEVISYTGPHTCSPIDPEDFKTEFELEEIERAVRDKPTQTIAELKKWWNEKYSYELETEDMEAAKKEAIKRVFGDWDKSFEDLPKLMSAFCSSNGLVVDWKYNSFANPKFASFCGVFWAFPQSIQGFQYCRPLIVVDTKSLNGEYQLNLMIASGVDAANKYFPLAFAVTKEVSSDSWRWFLTGIREKVTQREGLCLISSPHPDIVAVVNEPGSQWQEPWAYHRFCLNHLGSQFLGVFRDYYLENLVERAGCTSQKEEFDSFMKNIEKDNPEARKWLDQIPQDQWALVHDSSRRYGIMTTDTEALFEVCRGFMLPDQLVMTGSMLLLFDDLRSYFDKSFSCSRSSLNRGDVYTKPVLDRLQEFMPASVTYMVMPLDNNAFQVATSSQKDEWIVQPSDCTCACGDFERYKIPCLHALAVCKKLKVNPLQYVDDCYTLERLNRTYAATFSIVPDMSAWTEASGVPRLFPPPSHPTNVADMGGGSSYLSRLMASPPVRRSSAPSQPNLLNLDQSTRRCQRKQEEEAKHLHLALLRRRAERWIN